MRRKVINIDPKILSGTPVFNGTRVPVEILFDHLETGLSIDEFLDDYHEKKSRSGRAVPETTTKEFKGIYIEFLSIVGENLKCCDLNKDIIKNYYKTVWKLPANHTRKPKY